MQAVLRASNAPAERLAGTLAEQNAHESPPRIHYKTRQSGHLDLFAGPGVLAFQRGFSNPNFAKTCHSLRKMRGPELWKAGHNLVLSLHRADSFPNAVELAILGLETILAAHSVHLVTRRYSQDSLASSGSMDSAPCPCHEDNRNGFMLERSIWPRENLSLIFCIRYPSPPNSDEELILDMVLEQLICAGEHLPAEPDHDIDMSHLSRREREVLPLVAAANTNGQIATQLGISERTVEKHVASILEKTGLSNRKMIIAASPGRPVLKPQHGHTNFSNV